MPPILRWLTGWAASSVLWAPSAGRRAFSLVASGAGWCRVRPDVERVFQLLWGNSYSSSWRPGQSHLHPLNIPGPHPRRSACCRILWYPTFFPSLLRTHDLNVSLATLGQLVLLVLAARAEPSPSSQYTRVASSSICSTPYPLVPYI